MKKLIILLLVLGLAASASAVTVTVIKGDISCPSNSATKAGGDWTDVEWYRGCDNSNQYGHSWSIDGVNFYAGDPAGHCNLEYTGEPDPLINTKIWGDNGKFEIWNLDAGNYQVVVVADYGYSGTYNFTSTGPGDVWTVYSSTSGPIGLDNFILTPEPTTICLLGLGGLALLRRRR